MLCRKSHALGEKIKIRDFSFFRGIDTRFFRVKFVEEVGSINQRTGISCPRISALIARRMNRRAITERTRMESYVNRAETFSFEAAGAARQLARADTRRSS